MTATAINAINVTPVTYGAHTWLETAVIDCDAYLALPQVVSFQGQTYVKTGWNSDLGAAYYKPNGMFATVV